MILFILGTLTFVAVVTGLLSTGYRAYRDRHGYSPLVEPAPNAFPLLYRSPYLDPNKTNLLARYTNVPFIVNPPQSITSDIPVTISIDGIPILKREVQYPAYDAPSVSYTDLS